MERSVVRRVAVGRPAGAVAGDAGRRLGHPQRGHRRRGEDRRLDLGGQVGRERLGRPALHPEPGERDRSGGASGWPTSPSRATPCWCGPTAPPAAPPFPTGCGTGAPGAAAADYHDSPAGEARHLRLAASPESDEMVLVASNSNSRTYALVWNGSAWGNAVTLDATVIGEIAPTSGWPTCSRAGRPWWCTGMSTSAAWMRIWDGSSWGGGFGDQPRRRLGECALADSGLRPGQRRRRLGGADLR